MSHEEIEIERTTCKHCGETILRLPWMPYKSSYRLWIWRWYHVEAMERVILDQPESFILKDWKCTRETWAEPKETQP